VSKSAVEMYSDILRLEMKKWDVRVCTIEPQAYKTGLCFVSFRFCILCNMKRCETSLAFLCVGIECALHRCSQDFVKTGVLGDGVRDGMYAHKYKNRNFFH